MSISISTSRPVCTSISTATHLHSIHTSMHFHICTSTFLPTFTYRHCYTPSLQHPMHTYTAAHLRSYTPTQLHIHTAIHTYALIHSYTLYTHTPKPHNHPYTYPPIHLQIYTPRHLHTYTPAHLHLCRYAHRHSTTCLQLHGLTDKTLTRSSEIPSRCRSGSL